MTVTRDTSGYTVHDPTGLWWASYRVGRDGSAPVCAALAYTLARRLDAEHARRPVGLRGFPPRPVNRRAL